MKNRGRGGEVVVERASTVGSFLPLLSNSVASLMFLATLKWSGRGRGGEAGGEGGEGGER